MNESDLQASLNLGEITSSFDDLLSTIEASLPMQHEKIMMMSVDYDMIDNTINDLLMKNPKTIVKLNIGGQKFMTHINTLLRIKDTLFFKFLYYNPSMISKEIFIDRQPKYFGYILDYLRHGQMIDFDLFSNEELKEFKMEVEYYEVYDLIDHFKSRPYEVKMLKAVHATNSRKLINNQLDELTNKDDLTTGLWIPYPGILTIKLNYDWCIDRIVFAYLLHHHYQVNYMCEVNIDVSIDNIEWNKYGELPRNVNNDIVIIKGNNILKARYIRFTPNQIFGVGYLNIIPV